MYTFPHIEEARRAAVSLARHSEEMVEIDTRTNGPDGREMEDVVFRVLDAECAMRGLLWGAF